MTPEQDRHQQLIAEECDSVKELLLQKNADYGSSFTKPGWIFAKGLTAEQKLGTRIEDKLERITTGRNEIAEDTEQDLIGYLILKRVLRRIDREVPETSLPVYCDRAFDEENPDRRCLEDRGHSGKCDDVPF